MTDRKAACVNDRLFSNTAVQFGLDLAEAVGSFHVIEEERKLDTPADRVCASLTACGKPLEQSEKRFTRIVKVLLESNSLAS